MWSRWCGPVSKDHPAAMWNCCIIANLAQRYWREGRRLRPVEVVSEYEKTIFDELDLIRRPPTPVN